MRVANKGRILGLIPLAYLLAFAAGASAQGVGFAQTDYPVGSGPASVITADFNGDGRQDLAVANSGSNNVSILLGNGDGTFAAKTDFPCGLKPMWVTAGDFNADSKLDLITANFDSSTVSILLGNGDGTFAAASSFTVGNGPVSAAVGDFNGDGRLDLAAANQNADTISVLLGNGDGTFAAKVDFVTGAQPSWLILADFSGDTRLDLASANTGSNTVSVLLGNGDGTFGAKADFATGTFPRAVVAADLRKLLRFDLATANTNANSVSVLLGRADGTFDPRTDLGTDTGPLAVTSADFDNDGNPDLLTSNLGFSYYYYYSTVSLLRGKGDGTFLPRTDFSTGANPRSVATADFNGDGRTDAVTANRDFGTVSVLLQAPAINITPGAVSFPDQLVGTTSPPQTLTVASTGSFDLAIGSVAITGTDPSDFSKVSDTCSASTFPSSTNCEIQIAFSPSMVGSRQATLSIPSNAPGSLHTAGLFGTGVGPVTLSPTSVSFGNQNVGTTSATQNVTLTNIGTATVNITSVGITGTNSAEFAQTSNCPAALAPNASCTIGVTFGPTSPGVKSAALSVVSDAPGSPHTAVLSGAGTPDFSISASSTSATVTAGQTATFNLTYNSNGIAGAVAQTCSGAPPRSTCMISPATVNLTAGGSASSRVDVATTRGGFLVPASRHMPRLPPGALFWLATVLASALPFVWLARRRGGRLRSGWALASLVVILLALPGCNNGSQAMPGTPPGPYTITVSASSGGVTRSITLNLTVN